MPALARERVDHRAGPVDLPGQRVAGGAVAGALAPLGGGRLLLLDLDLDGIAEGLDLGEPLAGVAAERSRRDGRLAPGMGSRWEARMRPQSAT